VKQHLFTGIKMSEHLQQYGIFDNILCNFCNITWTIIFFYRFCLFCICRWRNKSNAGV